jgi:hypothetical protein
MPASGGRIDQGRTIPYRFATYRRSPEPQRLAVLVGQDLSAIGTAVGSRLLRSADLDRHWWGGLKTENRTELELRGASNDLHGPLRIGQPGKFDKDSVLTTSLKAGFGHPKLVDPSPEDLQSSRDRVAVSPGRIGLQDYLTSAF